MEAKVIKLNENLRDAVVVIVSQYQLLGSMITYTASGFLTKYNNHLYVITAAHVVLHSTVTDPMTSIVAGIYNVNGTHKNMIYKLKIVGVDATADVAILRITGHDYKIIPNVDCHPTIKFGDNLQTPPGTQVMNISNPLARDVQSLTTATIRDNKWFDTTGTYIVSNVVTSLLIYPASSGSPVIDINTGLCLSLITFGFVYATSVNQIGFAGGCGANTIKIILDHVLNKHSVNPVISNDGQKYLTNLKGYLGPITWLGVDTYSLYTFYPNNYQKLQIRGFILTNTSTLSPLSNLLNGAPPLSVGDIVVWGEFNNVKYVFGDDTEQSPIGLLLWKVDPSNNKDNIVKFGIIRDPDTNTKIEVVTARLNINYDPNIEQPPQSNAPIRVVSDTICPSTSGCCIPHNIDGSCPTGSINCSPTCCQVHGIPLGNDRQICPENSTCRIGPCNPTNTLNLKQPSTSTCSSNTLNLKNVPRVITKQ